MQDGGVRIFWCYNFARYRFAVGNVTDDDAGHLWLERGKVCAIIGEGENLESNSGYFYCAIWNNRK